jgi:hypothetical protein
MKKTGIIVCHNMLCLAAIRGGIDFLKRQASFIDYFLYFSIFVVHRRQTPLFCNFIGTNFSFRRTFDGLVDRRVNYCDTDLEGKLWKFIIYLYFSVFYNCN